MRLLRDYGTMPLAEILGPAIGYAENGYPAVHQIGMTVATVAELFRREWPTSAAIYLPNGAPPEPGRLFRNPALAAVYRRILSEAADGGREGQIERARQAWYRGFVAEAIDRFCRREKVLDASGRRHGGLLTGDDMARWEAPVETPLTSRLSRLHRGQGRAVEPGARSAAAIGAASRASISTISTRSGRILSISSSNAPSSPSPTARPGTATPILSTCRCRLCSARLTTMRDASWSAEHASMELRPGSPEGRMPRVLVGGLEVARPGPGSASRRSAASASRPSPSAGLVAGDTCHVDVIDRWGNMVSATPSGGWLQSSPVIPELGCCLGTRMQMFWLEEGLPSSLAPGKRPRSTLSPSMAFKDGKPYLAFGTPGGDQQDQWSLLMFLHHVHHGMNLQEAIDCPAFHTEHMPSSFYPRAAQPGVVALENRFPEGTRELLARRGHRLRVGDPWSEGRLSGCAREETPEGRILKAGANPRGMQGYAIGR